MGDDVRDMSSEQFREVGHRLVDWIADYRAGVGNLPVMARSVPGDIKRDLPLFPPPAAESFETIIADLERVILPGLTHWQHPRFFGYFPSNATLASVLGDFVSTGLGVLGISWQSSPALTELEEVVIDWVRQMIGLSSAWSGVIQDTASTSTLVALLCAREKSSDFSLSGGGLQRRRQPLTVYASDQSHSSVEKAALLSGFGREHLRLIPCDENFSMQLPALYEAVEADMTRGMTPCAIVATTGTTACTAFDPIQRIAEVAQRHRMWLHVDAAMAGSAMILPECRWMWAGVEGADSLVLNAHKWLGTAFDCSLYYVRDPRHLVAVMSSNPSYLRTRADGDVKNLRDWGLPLGRRFRALKLWFLIRALGISNLQARLRRDLENAQWLAAQVRSSPSWRTVAPVQLQTVCLRHEPAGLEGASLDAHTRRWAESVNTSGKAYLTSAILQDRWMVRVSIGAVNTEHNDVESLWEIMQYEAERSARAADEWRSS